jgi:hypothetical protein
MRLRFSPLTHEEECDRLLEHHVDQQYDRINAALDRQFQTIHNRAQLLLGVCGVLITAGVVVTTGRLIGHPTIFHHHYAGYILICSGALQIAAAGTIVIRVLNVRWITQQPGADLRSWILTNLYYRDSKTRAYRIAAVCLLLSMVGYQIAVAIAVLQL